MSSTLTTVIVVAESVLILALLVNLIVRQVKGQYMDLRRLWGVPVILTVLGVVYLPLTVHGINRADVGLVAIAVIMAVVVGLALGAWTTACRAPEPDRRGRRVIIRSGWKGGLVWLAFIAARLALQPLAAAWHAPLVTSAGVILILVAIARGLMAVVVSPRVTAIARR